MTTHLYLTPSAETALQDAADRVASIRAAAPLAPLRLLLPTAESVRAVRQCLGDNLGVYLHQFYGLAQVVLDAAAQPIHWADDTTINRLVHSLLSEMHLRGELTTFDPVWDKPGFNQTMVDWLREMKTQGIFPEAYAAYAETSGLARDQQLAGLYLRYQRFLQAHDLSDADGLLWLAAEALERQPALLGNGGQLFVLGFDQFNPIQLRILRALAGRFTETTIYLPWDAHRLLDSLALTRLVETRQQLDETLPGIQEHLLEERGEVAPALRRLRENLFAAPTTANEEHESGSVENVLRLFAAPSREVEARLALRQIKSLLLAEIPPDEIALLAPKPETYRRIIELAAEEYGIPIRVEQPLGANPAVQVLVNLLSLPPEFPRRKTLDTLRSPYICQNWLSLDQIDQLDRLSRERPVLAGRHQWQYCLRPIPQQLDADGQPDDDDLGPSRLAEELPPDELAAIEAGLLAFFDHLTPPENGTHRTDTLWLQERLLGLLLSPENDDGGVEPPPSLNLIACAQQGPFAERDLYALAAVLRHLRDLVAAAEWVLSGEHGVIPWDVYRTDLLEVLPDLRLPPDPLVSAVRFDRLEAARERPLDHVFILGLSEGEFPTAPPADVLYTLTERQQHPLPLRQHDPAADASLWWLVLASARCSLTLLRPRLDDSGAPWEASPYWDAVCAVLPVPVIELPVGYLPDMGEAASSTELLSALAVAHAQSVPPELQRAWQAAQHAYDTIHLRQDWAPAPAYEGWLRASDIRHELAQRYHSGYTWSASRLNRYGQCPFGFFAQYVLNLEATIEPEEGLDAMQRGSLLHGILERLGRSLAADALSFSSENQDNALQRLESVCDRVFPSAPERYGFRPNAVWRYEQAELRRLLRALVTWECEQNSPYQPYRQELRFGLGDNGLPRYRVQDEQGEGFYLHGVIDRLDQNPGDGKLRVWDYKSGSSEYSKADIAEGRALQVPFYAMTAQDLLQQNVAESAYLLIPKRKTSGRLEFSADVASEENTKAAIQQAIHFVHNIQVGDFPSLPSKLSAGLMACSSYCAFASLCRVDRHTIVKARRGGRS